MKISDFVDVIISLGSRPISQAGFETPLFIASHKNFKERMRVYTTVDAALDDGFDMDSSVYQALSMFFGQPSAPSKVIIGRRDFDNYKFILAPEKAGDELGITISAKSSGAKDKKSFTLESVGDATADATALVDMVNTDQEISPFVTLAATDDEILVNEKEGCTVLFAGTDTKNITKELTNQEQMDDALQEIVGVTSDFFFLTSESREDQDILDMAEYANANKKLYCVSKYDTKVLDPAVTDDIASMLMLKQYDNTLFQPVKEKFMGKEYQECGLIGTMASNIPGASTLHGKTIQGATASIFSDTDVMAMQTKNCTFYNMISDARVGFVVDGKMVSGNFFDVIRGKLWLEARLSEDIFGLMKRKSDLNQKIPFTNPGVDMVAETMGVRLDEAVRNGFLAANPHWVINKPLVEEIPDNEKANRILPDLPFEATLAGAMHYIKIRGYVTV